MAHETTGATGTPMAAPMCDAFVMVGDGSYLTPKHGFVTTIQERVKAVLVQNHDPESIGARSETLGSGPVAATASVPPTGSAPTDPSTWWPTPSGWASPSCAPGPSRSCAPGSSRRRLEQAQARSGPVLVHVETDPLVPAPDSESWWDVPVSEVAALDSTRRARTTYELHKADQRPYLAGIWPAPTTKGE